MDNLYTVINLYQIYCITDKHWTYLKSPLAVCFHSMGISYTGNNYYAIKTLPAYVVSKILLQDPGLYKFCPFFTPYSYYVPFH
jgi:hypothetical protein